MFGTQIAHIRRNFPAFVSLERSWICYFNRLLAATLRVHLLAPAGYTIHVSAATLQVVTLYLGLTTLLPFAVTLLTSVTVLPHSMTE